APRPRPAPRTVGNQPASPTMTCSARRLGFSKRSVAIDPIRAISKHTGPDQGAASRREHESEALGPPRIDSAAELNPGAWRDERDASDDGHPSMADQSQNEASGAAERHGCGIA